MILELKQIVFARVGLQNLQYNAAEGNVFSGSLIASLFLGQSFDL